MKYKEGRGWDPTRSSLVCQECQGNGMYLHNLKHGSLEDHVFSCECGCSWVYIMEGNRLHRLQVEYSR